MVGWSRRNAESAARERRYREWFNGLPKEEQDRITHEQEEDWKRNGWKVKLLCATGFLTLFVLWPLAAMTLRPPLSRKVVIVDGRECVYYPQTCTSTGACSDEETVCPDLGVDDVQR